MGKSNKKAKSDRINALRKQYDAFLEQDKKRKERNEYILGRLDKMRSCTALVPVRYKPNVLDARPSRAQNLGFNECPTIPDYKTSVANQNQLIPDLYLRKDEDHTFSIQEISKKYILIPKTRSSFMDNYVQSVTSYENKGLPQETHIVQETETVKDLKENINDNLDWKNKYEILNILKDEEGQSVIFNKEIPESIINDNEESPANNNSMQISNNYDNNLNVEVDKDDIFNALPEKDIPCNEFIHGLNNSDENNQDFVTSSNSNINDVTNKIQNITIQSNDSDATKISPSMENFIYENQPDHDLNMPAVNEGFTAEQIVHTSNEYISDQSSEYPVGNTSVINKQNVVEEQNDTVDIKEVVAEDINSHDKENTYLPVDDNTNHTPEQQYLVGVNQVQEYTENNDIQTETDVNKAKQVEKDFDINPTYENDNQVKSVIEQPENITDMPQEDFNTETRDMYYSDQADANDPYQQGEYQNQEYAYYEAPPAPEAYPEKVNDQVGMTQQYDPNYEQAYVGSDQQFANLDQRMDQQEYEQSQQYQAFEDYGQPQPEYESHYDQQNYEPQEQVGQVPHYEDGYNIEEKHTEDVVEQQYVSETAEVQHLEDEEQHVGFETHNTNAIESEMLDIGEAQVSEQVTS